MPPMPAARMTDLHICPLVTVLVPHVGGPIMLGSFTTLIGGLPAARMGDMCLCVGPPDVIALGEFTVLIGGLPAARMLDMTAHGGMIILGCFTVLIGAMGGGGGGGAAGGGGGGGAGTGGGSGMGAGSAGPASAGPGPAPKGAGIKYEGTPAEQKQLGAIVEKIRNAGPKGKAFVESLEKGATPTHLRIGTSATKKDGTVVRMRDTGGGLTLRPSESTSGENEITVDPSNLINYTATDGSTVKETPEGLLLHEMGHAERLNAGDPAQTTGGPAAEANVRTTTNDIRVELGGKPER